jgi:CheY-like chemotaxis protein
MTQPLAIIIEDDSKLAEIFSQTLKMTGFDTQSVLDGAVALERLSEITPDLILLDLHLPNVSGDKILRHIRATDRLAKTHVFLATADHLMAQTLQDEVTLVLIKPISVSQLQLLASRILTHIHPDS